VFLIWHLRGIQLMTNETNVEEMWKKFTAEPYIPIDWLDGLILKFQDWNPSLNDAVDYITEEQRCQMEVQVCVRNQALLVCVQRVSRVEMLDEADSESANQVSM
jgi:hypothetical protein